jgi:hypothetical protein
MAPTGATGTTTVSCILLAEPVESGPTNRVDMSDVSLLLRHLPFGTIRHMLPQRTRPDTLPAAGVMPRMTLLF